MWWFIKVERFSKIGFDGWIKSWIHNLYKNGTIIQTRIAYKEIPL